MRFAADSVYADPNRNRDADMKAILLQRIIPLVYNTLQETLPMLSVLVS